MPNIIEIIMVMNEDAAKALSVGYCLNERKSITNKPSRIKGQKNPEVTEFVQLAKSTMRVMFDG